MMIKYPGEWGACPGAQENLAPGIFSSFHSACTEEQAGSCATLCLAAHI